MESPTVSDLYVAACGCKPEEVEQRLFWACLRRRGVPIAWLLGGIDAKAFELDREFIAAFSRAHNLRHAHECVMEFVRDPRNRTFSRRALRIRVSAGRVKRLARELFYSAAAPSRRRNAQSRP